MFVRPRLLPYHFPLPAYIHHAAPCLFTAAAPHTAAAAAASCVEAPPVHKPFFLPGRAPDPKLIADLAFLCQLSYIFRCVGSRAGRTLDLSDLGTPPPVSTGAPPRLYGFKEPSALLLENYRTAKLWLRSEGWTIPVLLSGQSGSLRTPFFLAHKPEADCEIGYVALNLRGATPTAVVVFRGSITEKGNWEEDRLGADWSTNMDAGSLGIHHLFPEYVTCGSMYVHRGFAEKFQSVQKQLTQAILALLQSYPNLQLIVTGHSQGGALAQIAAWHIARIVRDHHASLGIRFHNPHENKIWGFFISATNIFNHAAAAEGESMLGERNLLSLQGKMDPVARAPNLLPIFKGILRVGLGLKLYESTERIKERAARCIPSAEPTATSFLTHYTIKNPSQSGRAKNFDWRLIPTDLLPLFPRALRPEPLPLPYFADGHGYRIARPV